MQSRLELEQEKTQIETELESVRGTVDRQNRYIQQLEEALILARNARFAAATESLRSLQRELFNEAESLDAESAPSTDDNVADDVNSIEVPSHQRRRGGRKPLPAELPRIEVVHELKNDERRCTEHDIELKEIGEKVSEQLDIIPMQIQVIRHIRKQYACPCCEGHLVTAAKPKQPIEKSWASAGLLAYIATSKYADGLEPYAYLKDIFTQLPNITSYDDVDKLLPQKCK